jgi:hypothetical protein
MIAGTEVTRSATRLLTQRERHRSCRHWQLYVLQQLIYEFCYQLGMHLKLCYRRRILIGPDGMNNSDTYTYCQHHFSILVIFYFLLLASS